MVFPLLDLQKTQLHACSGGKLTINPATGTDINGGVVKVVIGSVVNGVDRGTVQSWVDSVVNKKFGNLAQWDHLMYVFPDSVDFRGAAAYAYLNHYHSVYMGRYGSFIGVQVHELGHNYNMLHSGYGEKSYADHTGLMGTFSSVDLEKKLMFFVEQVLTLDPLYMHCRQPIPLR